MDVYVGGRMRLRRTLFGLSQTKVGEAVGLTFQQIQKYESGANRIGTGRLFEFSRILQVPVLYFFEDMLEDAAMEHRRRTRFRELSPAAAEADSMVRRETLELVRAYYRIPDAKLRRSLMALMREVAGPIAD